jgi:competence protein ComEA
MAQGGRFLFGLLTGLLAAGLLLLLLAEPRGHPIELLPMPSPAPVRVHVAGAVRQPGVVELPPGSIAAEAIAAAGGALPGADLDALNLAAVVEPGQRLFVPRPGTTLPTAAGGGPVSVARSTSTGLRAELETLRDRPSLASAIVQYRDQNGPFLSIDELLNVPGIGPTRLSQLRELVRVN